MFIVPLHALKHFMFLLLNPLTKFFPWCSPSTIHKTRTMLVIQDTSFITLKEEPSEKNRHHQEIIATQYCVLNTMRVSSSTKVWLAYGIQSYSHLSIRHPGWCLERTRSLSICLILLIIQWGKCYGEKHRRLRNSLCQWEVGRIADQIPETELLK